MKPQRVGRIFGTGLRVAGRMAGERLAAAGNTAPNPQENAAPPAAAPAPRVSAQSAGRAARDVSRGVGGFFRPFRRVGGAIWLEVMGVFFALPVVAFLPTVWRTRTSWAHGADHRTFLIGAVFVLLFAYLSVSSFVRAGRRSVG